MQFRTSFNLLMPTRVNCFNFIGTLFPFHPLYCTFHSQCTPLAIAFSDIRISCDMKAWAKPYQESNQEMSGRKQRKFFHEPVWAFKIGNKVKIFPLWLMVLNTMPPTTCVVFAFPWVEICIPISLLKMFSVSDLQFGYVFSWFMHHSAKTDEKGYKSNLVIWIEGVTTPYNIGELTMYLAGLRLQHN